MRFIKRLMEIKEEQLRLEQLRYLETRFIHTHIEEILKVLKGSLEDGKKK